MKPTPEQEKADRRIQADGKLVLFAGAGLLVADKPAGLASTGRTLDDPDCLQAVLLEHIGRRRLWAIHQLDRDTSGLNLFAIRKNLVARWGERLAEGEKSYLAVCHGKVPEGDTEIELAVGRKKLPDGRSVPVLLDEAHGGKAAHTTVRPLATTETHSLVICRMHSGRTHQVRLHMAGIGHPLVGERMHREPPCEAHPRHALHAWRMDLEGRHGAIERFEAPVPKDFGALVDSLGLTAGLKKSGAERR